MSIHMIIRAILMLFVVSTVDAGYCSQEYDCLCYEKQKYYIDCGWWIRCARYRSITKTCTCNENVCCPGYSGTNCNIPRCSTGCPNGGTCVSPDTCRCASGYGGPRCTDIDECLSKTSDCEQYCINTQGSYRCSCKNGFSLNIDKSSCNDIDECLRNTSHCAQNCTNTEGSYDCSCKKGFTLDKDGSSCNDIDECSRNTSNCEQNCKNTQGSYSCSCKEGYSLDMDGSSCNDIDECSENTSYCEQNCTNTPGSYSCSCKTGYSLDIDGLSCNDIDECSENTSYCKQNCTNTPGSYSCSCKKGYSLDIDGLSCNDIDECSENTSYCKQNCTNTPGSYSCSCKKGYSLDIDGLSCNDIDECLRNTSDCAQDCLNTPGSYSCSCKMGYSLDKDGSSCNDINECDSSNGNCENTCTNEIGSFVCSCKEGYYLLNDSRSCSDVDECNTDNGRCEQKCMNVDGTYFCGCDQGYYLQNDSHACADVNECELDNNRQCDQICNNNEGSFFCDCNVGYVKENDNKSCKDVNECLADNGGCHHLCRNEIGSYSCDCNKGFFLLNDSSTCEDVNECDLNNGNCEQICSNENGTFSCGCFIGFSFQYENSSCIDIDECKINNGGCYQTCTNVNGSYFCSCKNGYVLENDTYSCSDVDECSTDNGHCEQKCMNVVGTYFCGCDQGYYLQNDSHTCADVNECELDNGQCDQICNNNEGSFFCDCNVGYVKENDNKSCKDVNECLADNGGCHHLCRNEIGSYSCDCNQGFLLQNDNSTCEDVNECDLNNGNCEQICSNEIGTFSCGCFIGFSFQYENSSCIDIDECKINNGGCYQTCTNVNGSYFCSCKNGYVLENDTYSCSDVDECSTDNGHCEQKCMNVVGTYFCGCDQGYYLQNDSHACADVNECELDNGQCDQICNNNEGSFFCDCNVGYVKENDNKSCKDVNECLADNGGCHHLCRNEIGSYSCDCNQGFLLQNDNSTCEDFNECDLNNGNCEQICSNENGTFSCGCFIGFSFQYENSSCIDIDECKINNGGCDQMCTNVNGSYFCSCRNGYVLENDTNSCSDIDECLSNNGGCAQKCNNIAGKFWCTCEEGYSLENNGFTCSDVDECETNNGGCDQLCKNSIGFYSCDCEKGFTLRSDNVSCDDIIECGKNDGGCQQICTNLKGSFTCSCNVGHILNKDGFSCKNVLENSVSSSLNVLTGAQKVTMLQDPITYRSFMENLTIPLQTYFRNYTSLPFYVVVQQIRKQKNVAEQDDKANVIVDYTIVYDKGTTPTIRDNLTRGIFGFNVWTPLDYKGERMMAKLVNEGPTILPLKLITNISEEAPSGTVVGEFTVHDPDTDVRGEISVYSNDKPEEIEIGPILNDRVQLVVEDKLDADKYKIDIGQGRAGPILNFTIMVKDKPGHVASANVSLTIIDVNDNSPICNPPGVTVKIPRDSQIDTDIFSVNQVCRDEDYFYKDALYAIEGDTCSAIGIHTSGELYVKGEILSALSSCLVTVNVTDMDNVLYSTKFAVTIEFLECPTDVDYLHNIWERGIPGKSILGQCPNGYSGKVTRLCDEYGVYHDPVYNCTKREIAAIFEKVLKGNANAIDVLDELANVTATENLNKSLLIRDLEAVNKIMSKLTGVIQVNPENIERVANSFMETANNMLDESTTSSWIRKINQTGSGADIVIENIDKFVEKIANMSTTSGKLNVKKSNLYLAVGPTSDCDGNGIKFPNRKSGDVPDWAEHTLDKVQMSCDGNMSFKSYSGVLYRNLSKILPSTFVKRSTGDRILNAPVMSFTFFPKPEQDLDSPIEQTFQLYNSTLENPVCSFWSKDDSLTGAWSSAGCWLDRFTRDKKTVVCKCNHLRNFAVLMSPSSRVSSHHYVAMSTISMVGCILSMFCLASTIGIYGFFWRSVKSGKSILNMNLCCVLFVAYFVFLTGVNKTENESACTAVAVLLHLIYLIVFFTMLSEGLLLANTMLYPFSTRNPEVLFLIASYVTAILIVAISMGAVKLQGYGGEKSCWLSSSSGLVWAFLVPALLALVINITIVTLVIRKLFTTAAMSKKTDKESARAGVRSIIILMPIMGITWILGVFSVSEETVAFQYLFALFNSVQGVLIFVFYCVMNRKIQMVFRKQVSRWESLRSYHVHKSSTENKTQTQISDEITSAM